MLADFVSFALCKDIAVKEEPGAWFVLNKTEDIVPLTCILFFLFSFRNFKSDNQALQCKFVSSSM